MYVGYWHVVFQVTVLSTFPSMENSKPKTVKFKPKALVQQKSVFTSFLRLVRLNTCYLHVKVDSLSLF